MTRKHYILLAKAINDTRVLYGLGADGDYADSLERAKGTGAYLALRRLAFKLAEDLRADNPEFDGIRFIKACGFEYN